MQRILRDRSDPPGALIFCTLLALLLGLTTKADPDLWGHLRFGLDVLRDHALPRVDPYSFTQDRPQLDHEWGGAVLYALAWRSAGTIGLIVLKLALVSSTLALIWTVLRGVYTPWRVALLVLTAWAALPITGTMRPQLFSWLLLAAMLALVRLPRGRWVVPVLFIAWANLHGGWMVGLAVLGVWATTDGSANGWVVWASSAIMTLVTPYGLDLWQFVAGTVRLGRPQIQEWQPLWTAPPETWFPWLAAVGLVGWSAWRRRISPWQLLGCVGLAYASARVLRLAPFFVLVAVAWTAPRRNIPRHVSLRWPEVVAAAIVSLAFVIPRAGSLGCLPMSGNWLPDLTVEVGARGTLLVPFAWGEYALWRWGPGLRVSIDGRREVLYSDAVVEPQLALEDNKASGLEWLESAGPDVVWYPRSGTLVRQALTDKGYRLLLETPRSYVLAKPDVPATARLRTAPPCFPGD